MVQIIRHELQKQGNENVLIVYLAQHHSTEFARELGSPDNETKEELNNSVSSYIQHKLPNLKNATVKVMVGSMLLTSFAFSPAVTGLFKGTDNKAYAAELNQSQIFPDVAANRESAPAIQALVQAGIIKGYPDGFHPREEISRQHAAVMFVRALNLKTDNVVDPGFKDVPTTHPYYKEIAAATAAGLFNKAENFNPNGQFTRGQTATVLVRAYDLKGDKTAPFTDLKGSGHEDAIGVMFNLGLANGTTPTTYAPNDNVKREQFAMLLHRTIQAEKGVVDVVAAVSSVNVTDVNKVTVNFSAPVKDTSKVTAQLKKGAATHFTTANWSEDKKSVVLEAPSDIPAGDYDVIVTGLGDQDVKQTVKVEAEVAKSVELLNSAVAKMDGAKVSYKVLNQYGTDMEVLGNSNDLVFSVYNVTQGKDLTGVVTKTATKNEITIKLDADENAKINDKIRVISTYKGVTATKELTVVAASAVADLDLGQAALPKDTSRFTINTKDVKLPYTLKDQYGAEKKLTLKDGKFDGITFLSTDNEIVNPTSFTVDANGDLTFDIGNKAGTVTITSIINATGDISTTTLTVNATSGLKTIAVNTPSALIAAGDKDVLLTLTAQDQFGDPVTDLSGVKVVSSNKDVTGSIVNGKLQVVTTGDKAGTATLTLKDKDETVTYGSVTVNFEAKAVPTVITSIDTPKALESGANHEIKYSDIKAKDQYGRDYSLSADDITKVTAVDNKFDVANVEKGTDQITVKAGTTAGTEAVKFELKNGASVNVNFAVVDSATITSYSVDAVGTLFANNTDNKDYNATLKLTGKLADGTSVVLNNNKVTNATSSNQAVATVTKEGVVSGITKGTSVITLWNNATKLADITVNVDDAKPVASTATFGDTKVLTINGDTPLDLASKLVVKDQYGVKVTNPEGFFASTDDSVAKVSTEGVVTGVKSGTATITFVTKNGIQTATSVEVRK
ncbi:S-layer homology domain-containing protein [Pseudoneobacillus sp. C159]